MNASRKRTMRLFSGLTVAFVLVAGLVYTSFHTATKVSEPSELVSHAETGQTYQLTGKVVPGSVHREDGTLVFKVSDRAGGAAAVPVRYAGTVPDPFRAGREIIVDVEKHGAVFAGKRDSLITKCPSKFEKEGGRVAVVK